MDPDTKFARERFQGLTREELVAEVTLHAEEYVPPVRELLEAEALARGITPAEIEACRSAAEAPVPESESELPALIASAMDKQDVQQLAASLRRDGIPAVVREIDVRAFHGSGCTVGRWGLFVPGPHAPAAARRLEGLFPERGEPGRSCGGCGAGACGGEGEEALEPGDWDEDGDWWKSG